MVVLVAAMMFFIIVVLMLVTAMMFVVVIVVVLVTMSIVVAAVSFVVYVTMFDFFWFGIAYAYYVHREIKFLACHIVVEIHFYRIFANFYNDTHHVVATVVLHRDMVAYFAEFFV